MHYEKIFSKLPSGWSVDTLEQYAEIIDPHPSHRAPAEDANGYPFLGIGDLDYYGNATFDAARHVGLEIIEEHERSYKITETSIGYAKMGNTIGKVVSFPSRQGKTRFAVSPALSVINPNEKIHPYYLRAVVESAAFWGQVNGKITGSTRPSIGIQQLRKILIPIPPADVQKQIGEMWKVIYDKISVNTAINDNLQEQAQTLFAARFCLRGDTVPDDWMLVSLGDVAVISNKSFNPVKQPETMLEHYSIPAFDETRYPVFELSTEIKSNKFIVDSDCFMISKLNPTTKRVWRPYCITENAVCSTEFIVYKAKKRELTDFLYSLIDSASFSDFMCSHVTGSTGSRQRTTPSDTLQYQFYMPTADEIADFSAVVAPMYAKIRINALENARLKGLRDSLLPRLMSGDIDASEVSI